METNPYAPPKSAILERPAEQFGYTFRDINGLTTTVSLLLLIGIAASILGLASSLMQWSLLSGAFTQEQALANDQRERMVSLFWTVLHIVTICVYGRWIYFAHRNLPALGAENLRFRPGLALGSFFIPIYNFWGPFQAMNDLVRASSNPRQWSLEDTPALLVFWWILWIVVNFVGNALFRMSLHANDVDSLRVVTIASIIMSVLSIPLYLLARQIVLRVRRDQNAIAASL
jgi:uncharacterized protein DUF4328